MSTFRSIKEQIRKHLGERGIRGLVHLKKVFVDGDADQDGQLTFEEFASVLRDFGLGLSSHDMRILFLAVDKNHNERVDINEFVALMRGTVSPTRQDMITQIFHHLDRDRDGLINMMDIGACLNPKGYPDVASGRISSHRFLHDFLSTIQLVVKNGYLTLPDFVDYIASAFAFSTDEQLLNIMSSMWNTNAPATGPHPTKAAPSGRTLGSLNAETTATFALQPLLHKFRSQLARQGVRGIVGLGRKFRAIDDDSSGSLSLSEFRKCLQECGMDLSVDDANTLFNVFDENQNGHIDYEEFLHLVRGQMNARRRDLVGLAFEVLDRDGSGLITPEDLVGAYDTSRHPDVLGNRRTSDEVLREFLETFDVGTSKDGLINAAEFENYYENMSCSIDDDDYFELCIRNAFHISGGEGWCANTANKRMLVTDAQGNQRVEEVKNDRGALLDRQRNQGVAVDGGRSKTLATFHGASPHRAGPQALAKAVGIANKVAEPSPAAQSGPSIVERIIATQGPRTTAARGARTTSPTKVVPPNQQTSPGVAYIIKKLKDALTIRGVKGIIGLSRRFRIMDDDNDGRVSMAEFKKAIKEVLLGISDQDICLLFKHLDPSSVGYIDFNAFLNGIRQPLNERRLALVKSAFGRLDRDGSGTVDAAEIARAYTAAKHPDVLSGKKTAEEVFRDFLDTFEVGGEKDGKCTQAEFISYYTNISMSIDSDDYFELIVRNSWHISGGQGVSENSSNMRVLVTHSDGHQSVEEIKDDLGVSFDNKVEIMKRLKSQGLNVLEVSPSDGLDTRARRAKGGPQLPWKPQVQGLQDMPEPPPEQTKRLDDTTPPPPPKTRKSKLDPFQPERGLNPGIFSIVQRLKEQLKTKGAKGFIGMQRKFRIIDTDNDKQVSLSEFKEVLRQCDLSVSESDARLLFSHFDTNGSKTISFDDFLRGVRDDMNSRRLTLVRLAFQRVDLDGDGIALPEEVVNRYDACGHPEVVAGRMTETEVLKDFLESFDASHDGKVTLNDFIEFYQSVSSSIDSDDYFELMIRKTWHIGGDAGWSAPKRVLVTRPDGSRTIETLPEDVGLASHSKEAILEALRKQGVPAIDVANYGGADGAHQARQRHHGFKGEGPLRKSGKKAMSSCTSARASAPAGVLPGTMDTSSEDHKDHQLVVPHRLGVAVAASAAVKKAPPGIQAIVNRVRGEMKKRGARGVVGISRRFKVLDSDHSGGLTMVEFKKAMEELGLGLLGPEIRLLFQHFDHNNEGTISSEEFLGAIQGDMNDARLKLVQQAFAVLDSDHDGIITPQELVSRYDASKHPDVISGRRTAEEVMLEFLETFDVGGQVDGKVTYPEFLSYYKGVSCSVDQDDLFELMMTNAWHLSGAQTWFSNSADHRVLVKHRDGRETVEELSKDIDICPDNRLFIIKKLQERGINAIDVDLNDSADQTDDKWVKSHQPHSLASVQRIKKAVITSQGGSAVAAPYKALDRAAVTASHAMKAVLSTPAPQARRRVDRDEPGIGIKHTLEVIRQQLIARGATGFLGLMKRFSILDVDGSKFLSRSNFKKGLRESGVNIIDKDQDDLFTYFDINSDGRVSIEELEQALRTPLSDRRRRIVQAAFAALDKKGQGVVDVDTIKDSYDAFKDPEVICGKKSPDKAYREFLEGFEVGGTVDGQVTFHEFMSYYEKLGVSIDDDSYFELLVRNSWHILGGEGYSLNSSSRRVVLTDPQGNQYVEEIKNDLGVKDGTKRATTRQQGAHISTINLAWGDQKGQEPATPAVGGELGPRKGRVLGGHLISHFAIGDPGVEHITTKAPPPPPVKHVFDYDANQSHIGALLGPQHAADKPAGRVNKDGLAAAVKASGSGCRSLALLSSKGTALALLDSLKDKLKARGVTGIIALGRRFRIMDDDGNRSISPEEFVKALREVGLVLTREDAVTLFHEFDHDHSGVVDYEEFLKTLRGTLSPRRQLLVQAAFSLLDKDNSGEVVASEVASRFDASRHPDVLSGKRSANDVLREFFDTFEVGGTKDGVVTQKEFEDYYACLSASIDDDKYFELLMRNAWHITGGEHTTNKRLVVQDAHGVERVVEVVDDLGLKYGDKAAVLGRVKDQLGLDAASFASAWGAGDNSLGGVPPTTTRKPRSLNPTFKSTFTLG